MGWRGQDWGIGNEGEGGVKNGSRVLNLARTSVMVTLLTETENLREKQDWRARCDQFKACDSYWSDTDVAMSTQVGLGSRKSENQNSFCLSELS